MGIGAGPTGSIYLQMTNGGATAGTGSYLPQYHLDVAGTVRSSAHLFADNSAQVTATPALDYTMFGQYWTALPIGTGGWTIVAISASGQYQTGYAINSNRLYSSSNYGRTWTYLQLANINYIVSIVISASGQYRVATTNDVDGLYYSSDYGKTWTLNNSLIYCSTICMSASGQYATVHSDGAVYYSSNYCVTWTLSYALSRGNVLIACSASGQYQITRPPNGGIYYSLNYGQTWTLSNITTDVFPSSGAMSASGQYATITTDYENGVFITSDYGKTWTHITDYIGIYTMLSVSLSASGQYQVSSGDSHVYYSTNYGTTWDLGTPLVIGGIMNCAISANGQYILVASSDYLLQSITPYPSMVIEGKMTINGNILPGDDDSWSVGSNGLRFTAVYASGGVIETSDSSEKDLIILPYGLNEVMQVRTIMYKWKSQALLPDTDPKKNFQYYGICADQLSNIFPELVYNENPNVPMQLNYSELIPVVIKAVQEQNVIIQKQAEQITELKQRLAAAGIP